LNGGTAHGLISANNCSCLCTDEYEGNNCEDKVKCDVLLNGKIC